MDEKICRLEEGRGDCFEQHGPIILESRKAAFVDPGLLKDLELKEEQEVRVCEFGSEERETVEWALHAFFIAFLSKTPTCCSAKDSSSIAGSSVSLSIPRNVTPSLRIRGSVPLCIAFGTEQVMWRHIQARFVVGDDDDDVLERPPWCLLLLLLLPSLL